MSTRFILGLRLSPEHHYAFKPSPCLKRVVLPLNEIRLILETLKLAFPPIAQLRRLNAYYVG
ncbi:hypothetical protein [Shewanella morhuae]|uniref:hypothetical protein n=1 Tax=Shewanella morhuae TaxID=365591 RepID=UPI0021590FC8|nr:hypothetical protein [Shewanella morhuae]